MMIGGNTVKSKVLLSVFCLCLVIVLAGRWDGSGVSLAKPPKPMVIVSIVPQASFVQAVAGDLVDVVTMVPPGSSPANYAPTPQEMQSLSRAVTYFTIGVPTESTNILPKAREYNKNLKIASLAEEVEKVHPIRYFAPGKRDPHIWLSPRRAKTMVEFIATTLGTIDAKNKKVYQRNASAYQKQLDELDQKIQNSLNGLENKTFIVYHPAFGYFADDYGLIMLALEKDGKEATAKDLQEMTDRARQEKIRVIFYQKEFDSKQARAFAEEIGGKTEQIAPLAPNYIENLEKTALTFANVLK